MPTLGGIEIIVILVIALFLFGPNQLPKLGKMIGQTTRALRDGMEGVQELDPTKPRKKKSKPEPDTDAPKSAKKPKPAAPADEVPTADEPRSEAPIAADHTEPAPAKPEDAPAEQA